MRVAVVLLPLLLIGCGAGAKAPEADPGESRAAAEDDIREAVFRHIFLNNASGRQDRASAYFIDVEGQDPGEGLLARFDGATPPVKPASGATASKDRGVVDRATGESGLRFSVAEITWESDDRVTLEATYYEAGLSAAGYIYVLERRDGAWVVVKQQMTWIS